MKSHFRLKYFIVFTIFVLFLLSSCASPAPETTVPSTMPAVTEPVETTSPTVPPTTVPVTTPVVTEPVETVPPTTVPPETTAPVPTETEPVAAFYEGMDKMELKEWFFDFARYYWLDYLPSFSLSDGPPSDVREYLFFCHRVNFEERKPKEAVMTTEYVEQTVQRYFGFTPELHQTYEAAWIYDEETQTYTAYPGGSSSPSYDLLHSITYENGIYTVNATSYVCRWNGIELAYELRLKTELLEERNAELIACYDYTVSFRLDPETMEPVFCAYLVENLYY